MAQERKSSSKTFRISRDSKTGHFVAVKKSEARPSTTVIQRMPKPGRDDATRKNKSGRYVEETHRVSSKSVNSISKTAKKRSVTLKNLAQK